MLDPNDRAAVVVDDHVDGDVANRADEEAALLPSLSRFEASAAGPLWWCSSPSHGAHA